MDTSDQAWSRAPDQSMDPMAQLNSDLDDLGNLFEFGDIDLNNIPAVDSTQFDAHLHSAGTHPNTPFDELNEAQAMGGTSAQDFGAHGQFGMAQNMEHAHQQASRYRAQAQTSHPFTSEPLYQPSVQQPYYPKQQQFQFQGMPAYPSHQHVPPTPNSFDMHGEAAPFMHQQLDPQQRAILEQRYHLRKEDAIAFTPMVSPAGTPQYNVQPEFTIPGAYFSPLTSPMLHAQNGQHSQQQHQGFYTNPSTAPSSSATSPLDPHVDVDMDDVSLPEPANTHTTRSSRRKQPTPRSAGPLARVKQSPIQKATKRKSGTMLSSLAPHKEMDPMADIRRPGSAQPLSGGLQMVRRQESSDNGSISPEPLSEALMGPPPRPGSSVSHSPAIAGQQKDGPTSAIGAATPKSILSKRAGQRASSEQKSGQEATGTIAEHMDFEDLQLPAAATDESASRPSLPQINTQIQPSSSTEDTPRLAARKTPKIGATSTPSAGRPSSAVASPSLAGSPMTATTPGTLLKDKKSADGKGSRGNKKRSSVSGSGSHLVSPALRPRISPSIKPLLPEGASLNSPTHALLLASKSNYQNLLEGNHLPGVNYPDSLSTGLTSKRTSHKVAEQGRRNRINEALKEMQMLLPKSSKASKDSNSDGSPEAPDAESKESKEDANAKSNSSKAATVESANDYIRRLQKDVAAIPKQNAELLRLQKENEELKRKLDEQHSNSAASTSSAAQSPAT